MKIVCQSCSATYKIADDKVQGKKVFKLKCKKCGADILVRGSEAEAPAPEPMERPEENEATRAMDSAGTGGEPEGIWHAVINGDNQGPFSVDQLRAFFADGSIDAGTYVWREGFDGWQPMSDVGELGMLISNGVAHASNPADIFTPAPAPAPAPVMAPAAVESNGMFAPAEQRVARTSPDATSKARATSKGGDLFAAEARAQEAERPAVQEIRPVSSEAATGQRNENSVLFSLATLQQLSGNESNASSGAPSSSDSSGLIDINKLAGAINNGAKKSSIDDIMSVGSSSGLNSPLAAPVLAPIALPSAPVQVAPVEAPRAQGTNKTVIFTGAIVATIISIGGIAAVVVMKSGSNNGDGATLAANTAAMNAPTGTSPAPVAAPLPAPLPAVAAPLPAPVAAVPEANAPAANGTNAPGSPDRPRAHAPAAHAAHAPGATPAPNEAPRPTPSAAPSAAPAARPAARPSGGSIEDLLNRIPGGTPTPGARPAPTPAAAPAASPAAGGNLPVRPSQGDVIAAMREVGTSVRTCGNGAGGRVIVTITFANSGRVTTANASGEHAGDGVGSCAAQRVRSAHIPPFSAATFNVTYPFTLQ